MFSWLCFTSHSIKWIQNDLIWIMQKAVLDVQEERASHTPITATVNNIVCQLCSPRPRKFMTLMSWCLVLSLYEDQFCYPCHELLRGILSWELCCASDSFPWLTRIQPDVVFCCVHPHVQNLHHGCKKCLSYFSLFCQLSPVQQISSDLSHQHGWTY